MQCGWPTKENKLRRVNKLLWHSKMSERSNYNCLKCEIEKVNMSDSLLGDLHFL